MRFEKIQQDILVYLSEEQNSRFFGCLTLVTCMKYTDYGRTFPKQTSRFPNNRLKYIAMEIRILSKIGKDTYIQNLEFPLNIYITNIRRFLSATGPILLFVVLAQNSQKWSPFPKTLKVQINGRLITMQRIRQCFVCVSLPILAKSISKTVGCKIQ